MRSKEDLLTIGVADYLRLQYPNVLFCHIPNGGSRNAIEGAKLKKMGVRPGMPDIMIFKRCTWVNSEKFPTCGASYSGLAIELKIGKNKPTKSQYDTLNDLEKTGWQCELCYSFEEAKQVIDEYLK